MKNIKKFESYMSREEMYSHLCKLGYSMNELEVCSTSELEEICRNAEVHNSDNYESNYSNNTMTKESIDLSSREDMCNYLCRCGYDQEELDRCPNEELQMICREEMEKNSEMNESKKSKKWIQDAIKKPGSLKKSMGKKEGEKLTKSEIDSELQALKNKDKDKSKDGVQGLSKKDLTKFRRLNLAKTLKGLKEHQETDNYMFFANLENMHRMISELLDMDESQVDEILTDGHNWASDHIATSKDDIEEVYNFLMSHIDKPSHFDSMNRTIWKESSHEETEKKMADADLEGEMKNIKKFGSF